MEDQFWAAYRERERQALEWAKQDALARLAKEETEHSPAFLRLAFRMKIALGVAVVSLAALVLYAYLHIGIALFH